MILVSFNSVSTFYFLHFYSNAFYSHFCEFNFIIIICLVEVCCWGYHLIWKIFLQSLMVFSIPYLLFGTSGSVLSILWVCLVLCVSYKYVLYCLSIVASRPYRWFFSLQQVVVCEVTVSDSESADDYFSVSSSQRSRVWFLVW